MENLTILIGRVGKDAEHKTFGERVLVTFPVCYTETWKNKDGTKGESTTWYQVNRWGATSNLANYIRKGDLIYVQGKTSANAYISKDGEAKASLVLTAMKIEFLSTKETAENRFTAQPTDQATANDMGTDPDDDGLPF